MEHFFDDKAANWDNDPKKVERARIFAGEIITYLSKKNELSALDFGCGTGLLSFFLKDQFQKITLVDSSAGMIEVLKEKIRSGKIDHFTPVLADLLRDDHKVGLQKQDVIYTLMTLHHIVDLPRILSIFSQMIVQDGYICIADLVKEDGSFHASHPGFDGHNGFEQEELSNLLEKADFKVVYYSTPLSIQKNNEEGLKEYPLFLMIGQRK